MKHVLPIGAFLIAALASLIAQSMQKDPTTPDDWSAGANFIIQNAKPADLITTEPAWREDALVPLAPLQAQFFRTDKQIWIEDLYQSDAIWFLAEKKRAKLAKKRLPFPVDAQSKTAKFETDTTAALHFQIPQDILFQQRLSDKKMLEYANVAILEHDNTPQHCPKKRDANQNFKFDCNFIEKHIEVYPRLLEMQDAPRECIWAPPPNGNKKLQITFAQLELQNMIRIRFGQDLNGARKAGSDIHWSAQLDGKEIARGTSKQHQDTWPNQDIDTSAQKGKLATLIVHVWAEKSDRRYTCLNVWTR